MTKVIDVINHNPSNMMIEVTCRNSDNERIICFKGRVKNIPNHLHDCEVILLGFTYYSNCAVAVIDYTGDYEQFPFLDSEDDVGEDFSNDEILSDGELPF